VLNMDEEVLSKNLLVDFLVEGSGLERSGTLYLTNQRLVIAHEEFGLLASVYLDSIVSVEPFKTRRLLRTRRGFRVSFPFRERISEIRFYSPVSDKVSMDWVRGWVDEILKARLGKK